MDKKVLKNYIKKGKLFGVVSPKTTRRKSYISWYVIKNNSLFYVGSTNSAAIGMSRAFDCYLRLLDKYDLAKLSNIQTYKIID